MASERNAERNVVVSIIFRALVCSAVLAIAVGVFAWLSYSRPRPQQTSMADASPRVVVMKAQPVPVQRQWEGFGTAQAFEAADVPSRVTATVIERPINVRAGQPVARGQVLVQLDDADFQRQLEITQQAIEDIDAQLSRLAVEEQSWQRRVDLATEDVRLAREEYERYREALAREAARQLEVDRALQRLLAAQQAEVAAREELEKIAPRRMSMQAQRNSQEASLRLARLNVERSRITSPIDGVLQAVDVDVGENISAGQRVARVVNVSRIEVPLLLPAAARQHIRRGDQAILTSMDSPPRSWMAHVVRIAPEDDPETRTMRVFVEVDQEPDRGMLAPGKFVRGVVRVSEASMRWVVPRRALNSERVAVIKDGIVSSRPIAVDFHVHAEFPSLGLPDTEWVVLKEPVGENALIVVDSARMLPEGIAAVPVIAEPAAAHVEPQDTDQPPGDDDNAAAAALRDQVGGSTSARRFGS